ncbi:MAG: MBL fold metallo-hydrolase [Firmicutes bacterium]|nr:MBL fold metallo-hydrolase [Bacillota bacterium]
MIIKVLSENTAVSDGFGCEHGLSLYAETRGRKLLFDTGAGGLFAENAAKMGVSLAAVDAAVLSHGHYDHGGGLKTFLGINGRAKIYLREGAFGPYYADGPGGTKKYIGLDNGLQPDERFVFCPERFRIDGELELFSEVRGDDWVPPGNAELFRKTAEGYLPDGFAHEQYLSVRQNGKFILITGCSHRGIVNIVRQFEADHGRFPDAVIGGFHLCSRGQSAAPGFTDAVARELLKTGARCYTCHCTGPEAYLRLKEAMGGNIGYLSAGSTLEI